MVDIVVDGRPLINDPDGVAVYTTELLKEVKKQKPDLKIMAVLFKGEENSPKSLDDTVVQYIYLPYKRKIYQGLAKYFGIYLPTDKYISDDLDVMVFTNFIAWPFFKKARKKFLVIHDLAYLDFPSSISNKNRWALKKMVSRSIKKVDSLIAVSKFTAGRIKFYYGNAKNVSVISPAVNLQVFNKPEESSVLGKYALPRDYLICLSTIEPRKNITGIIDLYARLGKSTTEKYALVLAGGKGWKSEEIYKAIAKAKASGLKIFLPGRIETEDVPSLLKMGRLFIFLSYYEGFGTPPLEALASDTPVVLSNIEASKEVVGEAALIVERIDSDTVSEIENLIYSEKFRKEKLKLAESVLKKSTWQSSASKFLEVISSD